MVFEPAAPADTDVKRDGIYLNRDDLTKLAPRSVALLVQARLELRSPV